MKIKITWNREIRKLALGFGIVFLSCFAVVNAIVAFHGNQLREKYKDLLNIVIGNVLTVYPDVGEEELIRLLSGKENQTLGEETLARYGVFQEYGAESFSVMDSQIHFLVILLNLILLCFFLVSGLLLISYFRKRQQKISDLENYMDMLNRQGYRLDIEDNEDDELSGLRNEIYKLTVLLKEQAKSAVGQKRALADSVANISHQLKTPLTSMMVLMDNLAEDEDMDPLIRKHFISEITYQLTGMSWLVTTMLKISRLDAGVVELEQEKTYVCDLIRDTLQRVEIAAEWNGVSFSLEISEGTVFYGDRKWSVEALANIVKNAIEHSPEGSCVRITAEENDVYTQIVICDSGEGMTEEEREKIFCRFYNGRSAKEDSIGIGLALAKEVIEKQNGYICVDSKKDEGTRFIIRFLKT